MFGTISAGLGLATEVLKYLNTQAAQKLINDVKDINLQILAEEGLGYYSDDAKLETLYKQAKILIEAAQAEFRLHAVQK